MRRSELVEGAALYHGEIAARLGATSRTPVRPPAQRHVWRIAGQIEAVDRPAHHLLFPVIVEIGQQRRARTADSGMDVAIDARGHHEGPSGFPQITPALQAPYP